MSSTNLQPSVRGQVWIATDDAMPKTANFQSAIFIWNFFSSPDARSPRKNVSKYVFGKHGLSRLKGS